MRSYSLVFSLYAIVEGLLDQGTFAIVPMPRALTAPTTWRCVVLDKSKDKHLVYQQVTEPSIRVKVSFPRRVTI